MAYFGDNERWFGNDEQERIAEENRQATDDYERRVNEYNSRPAPTDWAGALKHQLDQDRVRRIQERNAYIAEMMNGSRNVYNNYLRTGNHLVQQAMQRESDQGDHLASAMKISGANGGKIPEYMIPGLNQAFGLDGKTATIFGGGFAKDGSKFGLMIARKNPQTGQVEEMPMAEMGRKGMYELMMSKPGIFSRNEMKAMRDKYAEEYMKENPGSAPLPDVPEDYGQVGDVGVGNRTETGGTAVPGSWLYGPQRPSRVSAFGADGRGGFTQHYAGPETGGQRVSVDSGRRADDDKGRWKQISVGADPDGDGKRQIRRYENDKTGEVVPVRDGETPPWEKAVYNSGSDKAKIEQMRQEGMNQRAQMNKEQSDKKIELARDQIDAKTIRAYADAENEKEKNAIKSKWIDSKIQADRQKYEQAWAEMAVKSGSGETRAKGNEVIQKKLDVNGGDDAKGSNKVEVKGKDNVEPEEIPGYAPDQIAELKKRGYRWNGSKWEK